MFVRPFDFLARFIVIRVVKYVNLPSIFLTIAPLLFTTARDLMLLVGIRPTVRVLNEVRRQINTGNLPTATTIIYNNSLNPIVTRIILQVLNPYINDCLKYGVPIIINKYFWFYISGIILSSSSVLIKYLIRFFIGLVLSSVGILWDETLSSIPSLKSFAVRFLEFVESHSTLKIFSEPIKTNIQSISEIVTSNDHEVVTSNDNEVVTSNDNEVIISNDHKVNSYNIYSIIGLILLGTVGIVAALCVSEHYAPDTVREIPVAATIVDTMHVVYDSISNFIYNHTPHWFSSTPDVDTTTTDRNIRINTDQLSRSNSTSSSSSDSSIIWTASPIDGYESSSLTTPITPTTPEPNLILL